MTERLWSANAGTHSVSPRTGCLQIQRKSGISGCKNSIKFLLIFASGNLMLAINLLESLKLWDISKSYRGFLTYVINVS
eukprot:bmy_16378T0